MEQYIRKCNVCGKIWCYTQKDLLNDAANNLTGALNAVGGIASAFGGTIFHQQHFADRMENDERKRVNRDQCPNCGSIDCKYITEDEFEEYKVREQFSKVQISINSNATTENLLTRAKLLLEDKDWASANAYCDSVLDTDPENGTAYLYKLMAELHVQHQEDMKDKPQPFDNKATYQKVLRFADDNVKKTLQSYIEHIINRNENNRLQSIYAQACLRMESATTESEFKAIAESFETILTYKDAAALQKKCLEQAEQARIRKKAETNKKLIISAVLLIVVLAAVTLVDIYTKKGSAYNDAVIQANRFELQSLSYNYDEYFEIIDTFSNLKGFKDSAARADEMREKAYKTIFVFLEDGTLGCERAIAICQLLGDYKDCSKLAVQLQEEYDNLSRACKISVINDTNINRVKKILSENQYVKDSDVEQAIQHCEQLNNKEWKCLTGNPGTFGNGKVYDTIKTTIDVSGYLSSYTLTLHSDSMELETIYSAEINEFSRYFASDNYYTVKISGNTLSIIGFHNGRNYVSTYSSVR